MFEDAYFQYKRSLIESLGWVARFYYISGGLADLATLALTLFLPAILLMRPISRPLRLASAGLLGLARLYDWLASPRVRPYDERAWLNPAETPIRLFQALIAGEQTHVELWSKLGWIRVLEIIVLVLVLLYLLTVVKSLLTSRGGENSGRNPVACPADPALRQK